MVTHDEIREELIRRLTSRRDTGKGIAKLLGIAEARVTEMKKRERKVQQREMAILAEYFGMGVPENDNEATNVVWVPIIGLASAGAWREAIEVPSFNVPLVKRAGVNQAFGVIVDGDSMDRHIQPRSYAIVDPDDRRPRPGRVYLIQNGGGETTIKRYMEGPPRFEPDSHNPEHQPIYIGEHEIIVLGRVVSHHSDAGL